MFSTRNHSILILVGALLVGALAGWFLHQSTTPGAIAYRGLVLRQDGYRFINPILACEVGSEDSFPEFKPIEEKLRALISQKKSAGEVQAASIYVRGLKSGRWFEVAGEEVYTPASLIKGLIMMAYFKEAEEDQSVLNRPLVGGTAAELIQKMIIHSDNQAMGALVDGFTPQTLQALKDIYTDLNIPEPPATEEGRLDFMSVRNYTLIFRVLFGSTYLTRSMSERALELLSQTDYTDGIVAGVKEGTLVAHKFGVREVSAGATSSAELHDCGIVYYPNHPYLLCVMTRGSNFGLLQKTIQDISRTTYRGLDNFFSTQ